MKQIIYTIILITIFLITGNAAFSQTLSWSQTYNSSGITRDTPNGNAIDASGNCYIVGKKLVSGFDNDFIVIKYNSSGVEEWVKTFAGSANNDDEGEVIKVGSDGNIYAAGVIKDATTNQDCAIYKITPDGYVSWSRIYNFSGTNYDYVLDILVDIPNGIYTTGYTYNWLTGNQDALTMKLDTSGNITWAKSFDSSDLFDIGTDGSRFIAKDNAGFIYTAGNTEFITPSLNFLKYSPNGDLIHSYIYDDNYEEEVLYGMKVDNSGNVYGVGKGAAVTMILVKLDSSLSFQWFDTTSYGTYNNDHAEDLVIGDDGHIYVCGSLSMDSGLGYFLIKSAVLKYSPSGNLEWTFTHMSNTKADYAKKIIASNDGTLFVLGYFWTPTYSTSHLKVMRLNSSGSLIDSIFYTGSGSNNMVASTLSIDANNSLYISLTRSSLANADKIVTLKYSNPLLPVELTLFNYEKRENNVLLNWTTSSELNNSGFDIERKDNANQSWRKIEFVAGYGNSGTENNYSYMDKNLVSGTYFYRLKQIDYNGNYKYYDLQSEVIIGIPQKFVLHQNYPNPFNPATKITFEIPKNEFISLKVYDISGREVASLINANLPAGYHTVSLNASEFNLSSGVYFYKLNSADYSAIKKMILLK